MPSKLAALFTRHLQPTHAVQHGNGARFHREVEEACDLLHHAISVGRNVDDKVIHVLSQAERMAKQPGQPKETFCAEFRRSYRDLAKMLAPVTAASLHATSDERGRRTFMGPLRHLSEARIWSRKLWWVTALFLAFVLLAPLINHIWRSTMSMVFTLPLFARFAKNEEIAKVVDLIVLALVPFAYGGLGSLAYVLRKSHASIYKREFDVNRIPEHFNRIYLGILCGGTIPLFLTSKGGAGAAWGDLSGNAVAFLAGYNTDLLFTFLERIMSAVLPKGAPEPKERL